MSDQEVNSDRRIATIADLDLMDRVGDPVLSALTRLARSVAGSEAAAVHVFDEQYQRRIAASGAPLGDHPEQDSMCRTVVRSGTRVITDDAVADGRFGYSSFVAGDPAPVRFYASVPLRVGGGSTVGTLCAFGPEPRRLTLEQVARLEDIAQIARAHLELAKAAEDLNSVAARDPLTGALNRGVFDTHLTQALARHQRHGTELLVCMIDFDDFKAINDAHGHAAGDEALRWVASRLLARLRAEDTLGRIGGDEFALVAELGDAGAGPLLAQIRDAPRGFEPGFTISVGAVLAAPGDTAETVMARADRAMYADKRNRRQD